MTNHPRLASASITDLAIARRERLHHARFYAIFDLAYAASVDAEAACQAMLAGGVDIIQLRAKDANPEEILELAQRMRPVITEGNGLFIINDHPDIAQEAQADGVHIGQDDMMVDDARSLLAPGQLVGKSTHSLEQATTTLVERPDYIGVGPLYATATKPDYPAVGLSLIQEINEAVALPKFCIGGVNQERLPEILAAGATRVVIVSAILQSGDIEGYCRAIRTQLDSGGTTD